MRTVMISDLKAHLSQYLDEARNGETIVVCDRKTPIARLAPLQTDEERLLGVQPATQPASMAFSVRRLSRPFAAAPPIRIRWAQRPFSDGPTPKGVKPLAPTDSLAWLLEDRGDR